MGVLVGISLVVIIPEGVETLYSSSSGTHSRARRDVHTVKCGTQYLENTAEVRTRRETLDVDAFLASGPDSTATAKVPLATLKAPGVAVVLDDSPMEEGVVNNRPVGHQEDQHIGTHHAWMGLALISGFILMYLVDKLPQYSASSKTSQRPYQVSLNDLGRRFTRTATENLDSEGEGFLDGPPKEPSRSRSFATTTGLVIHAAADGIALGASSSTSNRGLSLIIFFAIMVHKAPAAFGLTSVLLKQGVSKRSIRTHLLLFSLAAPTGAVLTWIFAHSVPAGRIGNTAGTEWWTGIILLFSGGTFLYVAMHTMQEVGSFHAESRTNGHADGLVDNREMAQQEPKPSIKDLAAAVFGMILPLFLQFGHAH